jgi:peroxiredoxin
MKKSFFILLLAGLSCIFKSAFAASRPVNRQELFRSHLHIPQRNKVQNDSILLNKPAPKFELQDLTGKVCSLENLKGKVVVLNFWFIACKPCVNEMPILNEIKSNYDPAKVVFIALSLDSKAQITAFLKIHQFDFIILPKAESVSKKYNLGAYPASMVINDSGIITFIQIGGPSIEGNLRAAINLALKSS